MHASCRFRIALIVALCFAPPMARATDQVSDKQIGQLYDRVARDLRAGRPLVTTIFVALCDNDAQGIVRVKNARICQGDSPDQNLYWASAGGLASVLQAARWQRLSVEHFGQGDLAVKAVWWKRLLPGGDLRARGVAAGFDAYIVGLGYRGARIRQAMVDYLRAVNDDKTTDVSPSVGLRAGGASHLVGYIGHDYFYDVGDARPLLALRNGDSAMHKGVFALSCAGHRLIRPAIARGNAHILLLNRTLGFPGAWTAEAIVTAIAEGRSMREIHHKAAAAFAKGQGVALAVALAAFAYGD